MNNQWISVKDQLPEAYADVLVVYIREDKQDITIGYFHTIKFKQAGRWFCSENEDFIALQVTHWMPLPELPGE